MSVREIMQDIAYAGSGAASRFAAGWAQLSPARRRVYLILAVLVVLFAWLGPRFGLVGKGAGGLTDEELRLIEQLGNEPEETERLPPWYQD